jgi:hypothetical protein
MNMAVLVVAPGLAQRVREAIAQAKQQGRKSLKLFLSYTEWEELRREPDARLTPKPTWYAGTLVSKTQGANTLSTAADCVACIEGVPILLVAETYHPTPGHLGGEHEAVKV